MPVKLGFSVAGCSGEDADFPASELLLQSPDSKGWCTPRFSQYPQELTLALDAPARLAQIQLLSHEFKIAGKVELLVAPPAGPWEGNGATGEPAKGPAWRRLGFLSFDSNEHSSFTARELKSVALNGPPAALLRLVFHRCHANAANIYGQVSLVAISLLGDPLAPAPLASITNTAPGVYGGAPAAYAGMQSPPLGMAGLLPGMPQQQYVQPPLAGAQQQQQQQQQQFLQPPPLGAQASAGALPLGAPPSREESVAALAAEMGVDAVTAARIYNLQEQKQRAVDREDYDEAKRLKAAVERLRAAGGAIAALEARKRAAVGEEDYDLAKQLKGEVDRMRAAAYAGAGVADASAAFSPPGSRRGSMPGSLAAPALRPSGDGGAGGENGLASPGSFASPPVAGASPPGARRDAAHAAPTSYDERPAKAKGAYSFADATEESLPTAPRNAAPAARGSQARGDSGAAVGSPPPGFPADLPAPEALSAADAKDAGPLPELLGDYLTCCAFSKTWQLREAALARVAADLESGSLLERSSDALKPLARALLARSLRDKVPAVVGGALRVLRALVAAAAGRASQRDLQSAVSDLLPALVEKASDLNQRTREQATEALVALAGEPAAGLAAATAPFLRAPKAGAAWKVVLGRLQLVSALLPVIGMAGRSGEGFQLEPLMEFVGPALSNSSAEVRGAAVALTLQVAQLAGPGVQRLLPAGLNAKVKEQIEAGLLNPTAALPAQPARAAAAAKPAPAAAAAPRKPVQQATPAVAAAVPPSPPPAAAPAPAQQAQQTALPAPGPDDDPAVYEAEVRAREARLGASHPDVAEAICNLAIVHNQRGNVGTALPLYERALAIWEAASGPDAPVVAHTLTDIAVIHLEMGRDDIGRPLLQRALRIQEAHLGPDHPDVMAIRDVLEEE